MWRHRITGHHMADNYFSASWRDLEIQIQLFYEFERRKELDGGAVGRGVLLYNEKSPSQIIGAATIRS
jgi:hypothetical protein